MKGRGNLKRTTRESGRSKRGRSINLVESSKKERKTRRTMRGTRSRRMSGSMWKKLDGNIEEKQNEQEALSYSQAAVCA